jgi:monoamine oxidase
MSPHGESAQDPLRPPARPWAAESPFVGDSAEEEQAQIHPWYRGYSPFVEGREEGHAPEGEWESDLAALEPGELGEELVTEDRPFQRPSWQPLSLPRACQVKLNEMKKKPSVAVVGGGFAGLMAARWLGQQGIEVTVFEARPQVGGRVLSNRTFSNGRITEEGAELIGSFHTAWLALARKYGLAVVSRMDKDLYERAGLDIKLTLDKKLPVDEIRKLDEQMEKRVLEPIARLAGQIRDPSQPWLEPWLDKYDKMSVADALVQLYGIKRDERLWKAIEFKLVNDEVAPLDRMNFLGLLCKVKAGQDVRFSSDDIGDLKELLKRRLMRYWNELEIFRCADGCQTLATRMADEIKAEYGAKLHRGMAVTHINLSTQGVKLGFKQVVDERKEKLADGLPQFITRDYVILAIPPSVWAGITITETAGGKTRTVNLDQEVGAMGMDPAVKCFSDAKKRFWIEEKPPAAPYGGSSRLGQVWEGTDNQTRVGNQGIVLSVFAGPIIPIPLALGKIAHRAPTKDECKKELRDLYRGYTDENLNKKEPLYRDWPTEPFIKTGYYSPRTTEIFKVGPKLRDPFLDRLFFAGEHTQLDFFGYMEGALRSGERAAHTLILQACGMGQKSAPTSSKPPVITAGARTASEHETLSGDHSSTSYPEEAESPYLPQGSFVGDSEEERDPRGAQLVAQSPVAGTIEERQERFDALPPEGTQEWDQLEGEEGWGELDATFQTDLDESLREYEAELESLEDLEDSYFHEHESREELARLKETEGAAPDERLYFEYDVPALGSAKNDHPLREIADGQRGKLPDDILAAILTRGESDANDLTNRIFWQKHRDLSDKMLDPKDPRQKALREEWAMILRRQVEPIIWLPQIIDQLDRHRGGIPREFLLGWIAAESDGRISTVSTLGERGYFQIMWQSGEAKEQLGLTRDAFLRLSTDREFSVEKGVQLAKTYRQHFLQKYPTVPDGSDLLWRLTKGRHALPGALDKVLDGLVKAGATITWQAVSRSLPKMASSVNFTLDFATRLKPLADLVPAPPATTPELYAESSPRIPGSGYEDRVSEVGAELATEEELEEEQLAPWAAGIDPFPAAPTVAFDFSDDRMMKAFAPVTVSSVMPLCTALVDLTGDPVTPPYAGLYDKEMIFAGSLPKICAMYAAFALRVRVQAFVDAAAANGASVTPPGIISEIEKAWKPKLRALFPDRPAKSFGNNQDVTFPKLGQILTFSPDGKVDFKRATPSLTDARIDRIGGSGAPEGMFHDWMRSMLRWSNNAAASKCILALGYFYLNGALARAGLFDAATGKGLWLSADYKSHDWVKTQTDRQANAAGQLLTPRWATAQRRRRSNITATAAQVARFMTLLALDKLIPATDDSAPAKAVATAIHGDMRALMKADAGGLGSDANDALRRVGRAPTLVIAKFGRGDDGFNHECAIIERTVAGKSLRYVAIGLGSAPKREHQDLFDLFVLLDETVVTRNR